MMIHQKKTIAIAIFVMATLIACAAKQPQPIASALKIKGHSEIWLDKRIIQIDFKGNNDDKVDRLKDLAVLRAAELGRDRGFDHFVILNTTDQTIIDGVIRKGDQFLPIEKLKISVTIKFVNKDDAEYPKAFDIDAKIAEIQKNLDK
jgi:hypothetical protein